MSNLFGGPRIDTTPDPAPVQIADPVDQTGMAELARKRREAARRRRGYGELVIEDPAVSPGAQGDIQV